MDYSYSYNMGGGGGVFFTVVWIAVAVLAVIGLWKTLSKAGLPGWAAIIPFYNEYNVVKMSNRPLWFFWAILGCSLFAWIPLLGFVLALGALVLWIFIALDIAANFGQGTGFAILLIIFPWIMFLILGFGSAQFDRVAAPGSAAFGAPPTPLGGSYSAAPPAPPAPPSSGYAPAPPAAGSAPPPAPPAQTGAPVAPVTPPVTPTLGAPAAPVTPTEATPARPITPAEAAGQTEATVAEAEEAAVSEPPVTPPETPEEPETPPEAPPAPRPPINPPPPPPLA